MITLIKNDKTTHGPFQCNEDAAAFVCGSLYYLTEETVIVARDGTTYMLTDTTFQPCAWRSARLDRQSLTP